MKFWTYQIQLKSGEVEKRLQSKTQIKQALNACYGGLGPKSEPGFEVQKGFLFDNLPKLQPCKVMDGKTLEYYAEQYARTGMHQTST